MSGVLLPAEGAGFSSWWELVGEAKHEYIPSHQGHLPHHLNKLQDPQSQVYNQHGIPMELFEEHKVPW